MIIEKSINLKFSILLTAVFSTVLMLILTGCNPQNKQAAVTPPPVATSSAADQTQQVASSEPAVKAVSSIDEEIEDTVVINVSNIGRGNPFKPYLEKSLMIGAGITSEFPTIDVPQPPNFNPNSSVSTLLKIKVNGILYDPAKSSAIISVDDSDYMVHKGDFIFDFYIKDITKDKVSIKTGNNVYSAGIGEIIEGTINEDPVQRTASSFAGTSKSNYAPDIKILSPSSLPSIN